MRASEFHLGTQKEAPSDAEIASHRLMSRAGMVRKLSGGIYTYMPLGLRVLRRMERIIREEMTRAGAVELLMPVVQPAELWMESGRWEKYGPELLRIKDRHQRDFIIQPTSEEVITDVARQDLRSYRNLPRCFFHIQTKFRDERRPRFGVMRGREFTMKDAYSFDRDQEGAMRSYRRMFDAYCAIFDRMGLTYRAVAADTGSIGGSASHEFQVIADTGEDAIAWNPDSDYAANVELAEAMALGVATRLAPQSPMALTPTPGASTCAEVARQLGIPIEQTVKSLVLAVDSPAGGAEPGTEVRAEPGTAGRAEDGSAPARVWLLLLRGDHTLNEIKVGKLPGLQGFRFATEAEIRQHFGGPPGYLGPVGLSEQVGIVVDRSVARISDFVCGANQDQHHYTGVNWGRDLPEPAAEGQQGRVRTADIRNVVAGDPSPDGKGTLQIQRGIEVGHVFYLGTTYSAPMKAEFIDEDGRPRAMEMGCYGIGVTRLIGAAIEQNHDEHGMVWPRAVAPFDVVICPLGMGRSEAVRELATRLHGQLQEKDVDVMLDDRDERPGAMFADWELIGVPLRITIGDRGLKEGLVELTVRRGLATEKVPTAQLLERTLQVLAGL